MALSDLDLLSKSPSRNNTFPTLRKALRLIVDDVDEKKPTDISYTYSGYAPLSIRLVQCIAQKPVVMSNPVNTTDAIGHIVLPKAHSLVGWRGFEDIVKSIPGAVFDDVQTTANAGEGGAASESYQHRLLLLLALTTAFHQGHFVMRPQRQLSSSSGVAPIPRLLRSGG
jgi:vacuolar protein sorting-associated protein 33A